MNGKGFWKFNNSLLVYTTYINSLKINWGSKKTICLIVLYNVDNLINIRNEDIQFTVDDQLFIDIILTKIMGTSILYSAFKENKSNEREKELEKND